MVSKKQLIFYTIFLAIYAYEFSKTQQLTVAYNQYRTNVQYIGVIVVGLGFLLFYISRKLFSSAKNNKILLMCFNVIYIVGMLYMLFIPGNPFITMVIHLSLGYLGGAVYYYIAAALGRTRYVGRVAMSGQITSILLQMLLPEHLDETGVMITILVFGFILVAYLIIFPPSDWMFEEMLPYAKDSPAWSREVKNRLVGLLVIVIFADIFGCLVEITWTTVQETGGVDMYTYPRFFMILGYLTAGFFADFKKHKYLDTSLLIILGFGFSGMYMTDHIMIRLSIFYIMAGFIILYMNIKFWHLAPYTKAPELWSSFGRIIFVMEGFVSEIFIRTLAGRAFYCSMLLALLFAFVVYFVIRESSYKTLGEWILFEDGVNNENVTLGGNVVSEDNFDNITSNIINGGMQDARTDDKNDKIYFRNYVVEHDLTPRESDVLKYILTSEESMKTIAARLDISERMLYRYMKQLYEKTGTETRAGLVKDYYSD